MCRPVPVQSTAAAPSIDVSETWAGILSPQGSPGNENANTGTTRFARLADSAWSISPSAYAVREVRVDKFNLITKRYRASAHDAMRHIFGTQTSMMRESVKGVHFVATLMTAADQGSLTGVYQERSKWRTAA